MEQARDWKGSWIWSHKRETGSNEMVLFRKTFEWPEDGRALRIHISADSRYRLFVNGRSIGIGPCKGDLYRRYYETFEIREAICPGLNTIAVQVLHYASGGPSRAAGSSAVWRSPWGGLVMDGELLDESGGLVGTLATDNSWSCQTDESYRLENETWISGNWMGGVERIEGMLRTQGWELSGFDDSGWSKAVSVHETYNAFGVIGHWPLLARTIPHMKEEPRQFLRAVRSEGWPRAASDAALPWEGAVLPANRTAWIELDAGELTTGYLRAAFSGGRGSLIRLLPAECYESRTETGKRIKGMRDDASEGQFLVGDSDHYQVAGAGQGASSAEAYEPFWFRTFRFVRLEIAVADEALTLHELDYRETGYPLEVVADFGCSDESYSPLWDNSVRTLIRCMHETYEDCPYYEQLQYTMDTELQMLFTYNISGDDRLARKAIFDYHSSRLPDGMLQCRYPTVEPQVIPGFSLYWIFMLYDHYRYFGDMAFLRPFLPTADGVLEWFRRRIGDDGLVGAAPRTYWSYVDWVAEWPVGVPSAAQAGPLTVINLMFATALTKAAELQEAVGRESMGREYRELAAKINAEVGRSCWSQSKGLYRDGPSVEQYSQHSQLWAVLSGLVSGTDAVALMRQTMERRDISKASYSMAFFLFRALEKAGVYDELAYAMWEPWHEMVRLNLTTWAENPNGNRSDCHAWGAAPLYEFPRVVLGIRPAQPGFAKLAVAPSPGLLQWAEGSLATPQGLVRVRWERQGETFALEVDGPGGVPVIVTLPDGTEREFASAAGVRTSCAMR